MSIVLRNQLQASAKSVEELRDQISREHRRALFCHEVQDLLRNLVQIFDDLNRNVEKWQDAPGERADAQEAVYHELYRSLDAQCEGAKSLVHVLESWGYTVDGKREFFRIMRDLKGVVCFSRQRTALASDQLARGEGRALGSIVNELRDHPGA